MSTSTPFVCFLRCVIPLLCFFAGLSVHADDDIADRKSCLRAHRYTKGNVLQDGQRPVLAKSFVSSAGHFTIHYDVSGTNAVADVDLDANGVPDFVDSAAFYAEHAYTFETKTLGFQEPLKDSDDPSSWDIYVMQIGAEPGVLVDGNPSSGLYGLALGVDYRRQPCDSNRLQCSGFIVIDNNFSITDSIRIDSVRRKRVYRDTGIVALKVTLAHEFHHMVQFSYSADLSYRNFSEMTSVWMEHQVYPDNLDYLQYLKPLMNSTDTRYFTDTENSQSAGYAHAFYLQYLQETSSRDVIRGMWELMGACVANPVKALDSVLSIKGSSFAQSWCSFMPYVYHTGYRSSGHSDALSNADSMPVLRPFNYDFSKYSPPSLLVPFSLFPYQFRLIRCTFSTDPNHAADTADIVCTCIDTKSAISGDHPFVDLTVTFSQSQGAGAVRLGNTNYFYTVQSSNEALTCDRLFFTGGIAVQQVKSPYPQPYSLATETNVYFPVSESIPTDAKVRLTIASVEGTVALSEDVLVTADPILKTRYITWTSKPSHMSSGVYIYTVSYNDNNDVGTFLVKP